MVFNSHICFLVQANTESEHKRRIGKRN